MDNRNGETPVYFDGSKHLMTETSDQQLSNEVSESAAAPDEWRRFIGANPYEFELR